MLRTQCVYCENNDLQEISRFPNFPTVLAPPVGDQSEDKIDELVYVACYNCGSVQLKNLTDPDLLYQEYHNNTTNSQTWQDHHSEFANFILNNTSNNKLLEVGGYTGVLASRILPSRNVDYTVLDLCSKDPELPNVKFISGNCEEFDYDGFDTIALSHIFEHLYYPKNFVKRIASQNVKDVFISIPNMNNFITTKNFCILHVEHTFFCSNIDIKNLFAHYGFKCATEHLFRDHSIFFHFQKTEEKQPIVEFDIPSRIALIKESLEQGEKDYASLVLPDACYLAPAGVYGQKMYYYLQNQKEKIIGFLDNDPCKIKKRVYGTPLFTYSSTVLSSYGDQPIHVLLFAGPYKEEIQKQYLSLNPSVQFIHNQ